MRDSAVRAIGGRALMRWRIFAACWLLIGVSWAIDPEPAFEDPVLEATYQSLVREVRCLVCQNQTIADSNAQLAADLRREIRGLLAEGATREEVADFLVARYGEFVLYRPRLQPATWALWGAPVILLLIGGVVFARILRSRLTQSLAEDDAS